MSKLLRFVCVSLLSLLSACSSVTYARIAGRVDGPGYSGSAFLYRGYVVTAGHVCSRNEPLELIYMRGGEEWTAGKFVPARSVFDGSRDACILRRTGPRATIGLDELEASDVSELEAPVTIVGAPYGLVLFRTDGYLASTNVEGSGYWAVSAPAAPGNSGSPVVDEDGRVLGILVAGMPIYEHASFVTPISVVDELIDGLPN